MREQKWNLGRFIGRSSALLLLFALLFLPSARAEEGENLPKIIIGSDEYQPYSYYNVDGARSLPAHGLCACLPPCGVGG